MILDSISDENVGQDHVNACLSDKPAQGAHAWRRKSIGGDIGKPTDYEGPGTDA